MMEGIYYGALAAMVAEVSAFDAVACGVYSKDEARYAVQPIGDGQWDAVYLPTLKEAREHAAELAREYGCRAVKVV